MSDPRWAWMAEYETAEALVGAAQAAHAAGYRHAETYAPYPVEGLAEAVDFEHSRIPTLVLIGNLVGGTKNYLLQ